MRGKEEGMEFGEKMEKSVAEILIETLKQNGVKRIFGIPRGGCSIDLIEAAANIDIEFVLTKSEDAAVGMLLESTGHRGRLNPISACTSDMKHFTDLGEWSDHPFYDRLTRNGWRACGVSCWAAGQTKLLKRLR